MEFETIRIEGDGPVRHLILNRPHVHNAVNRQFVADMNAALWKLDRIKGLRVVILHGEGKSFCSGADLKDRPFNELMKRDWGKGLLKSVKEQEYAAGAA